jgi:polysaccharide pyruvyl transferase WcaK-like protein
VQTIGLGVLRTRLKKNFGPRKIALLGNFGQNNLGNEATLRAILENLRIGVPEAELTCICTEPTAASLIHGIPTIAIHPLFANPRLLQHNPFTRLLRKVAIGIPNAIRRWLLAIHALRHTDMLIIPGTQFLSDSIPGPWGWPYWAFQWCIAARLRGSRVLFVSVGVGPLFHPLSRFFVKSALRLADFRSYRDETSKQYLRGIGFHSAADSVYPDLVFSLRLPAFPESGPDRQPRRTIAVGVKDFHGQYDKRGADHSPEPIYQRYISQLTEFLMWLLQNNYNVRLVIGDVTYDSLVLRDVRNLLAQRQVNYDDCNLISEPIETLEELLRQLASCDAVVSPRFHNIVFGLMLNRPVLAISYHEKFAALLESPDLAKLSVAIEDANPEIVIGKFQEMELNRDALKRQISHNVARYETALSEQYQRIFNLLPPP